MNGEIEYLESLIFNNKKNISLDDAICAFDICDKINKELIKTNKGPFFTCVGVDPLYVSGVMWSDYDDHDITIGPGYAYISSHYPVLIKYIKENGSGKYDNELDEMIKKQVDGWEQVLVEIEIREEKRSSLPGFLKIDEVDDDEGIIWVDSTRDDIYIHGSLSKNYYCQP